LLLSGIRLIVIVGYNNLLLLSVYSACGVL